MEHYREWPLAKSVKLIAYREAQRDNWKTGLVAYEGAPFVEGEISDSARMEDEEIERIVMGRGLLFLMVATDVASDCMKVAMEYFEKRGLQLPNLDEVK